MDLLISVVWVFMVSIVELWLGIPLGLYLDLNPVIITITAAAGSILSAVIVATLGEGLRKRFLKWRYGEKSPETGKIYDIWRKYGIIGLGLLSPLLLGAPLGAALGIGLGAPKDRLLLWMSIGIVIWSALLTTVGFYGLMSFESVMIS